MIDKHPRSPLMKGRPATSGRYYAMVLMVLFSLAGQNGCATLPHHRDFLHGWSELRRPPRVVGPFGELSPQKSKRILDRLAQRVGPSEMLERHAVVMQEVSGSPLIAGNKATLLVDGTATYTAMFKAVQGARDHINLETFIFEDDELGRRFANLLLEKQEQGVQVNLIYDSVGSQKTPADFFQWMRDGGINVLEFNPVNPLKAERNQLWTNRDHRKILIVDGEIAFTGGVNVSQVYSASPSVQASGETGQEPWHDTHIQLEGPAVAELQKLFLRTWDDQKGPELGPKNYFPALNRQGRELVQVVGSTPGEGNGLTYIMYLSAITFAEKTIHLTNAYFVPDDQIVKALTDAAQKGLDVRIILPGKSDMEMVLYAGRSYYTRLLKSGVKLYERKGGVLHDKTAVIDQVWSTVGSTNLDLWSFARNNEVNAIILGSNFVADLEAKFRRDLADSDEILLEKWEKRPFVGRLKEWLAHLFADWL